MNTTLTLVAIVLACLLAGCSPAPHGEHPTTQTGMLHPQVTVAGAQHKYALSIPDNYTSQKPWPLIIFLNGRGECGTDGNRQTLVGLGPAVAAAPTDWPFVIVYPQKPDPQSTWAAHDALVMATLEETCRQLKIDRSRIYLTGLSQGGAGTFDIAAKHPDTFAAIAPVCGFGDAAQLGPALKSTPLWAFHGEQDDVVPPAKTRDIIAAIESAGGKPKATYFPDANHNSWDAAYRTQNLGAWLLENRRP